MQIGTVVNSSSHIQYGVRIIGEREAPVVPRPRDYGFGTFCGLRLRNALAEGGDGEWLVGIIYDTMLLNPEYGMLGPRLSPRDELAVFSPDQLVERATLVSVLVVGTLDTRGAPTQGVPTEAALVGASVETLDEGDLIAFHLVDGRLQVAYLQVLTSMAHALARPLMRRVLERLMALFPHEADRLEVLGDNLAWKAAIEPLG